MNSAEVNQEILKMAKDYGIGQIETTPGDLFYGIRFYNDDNSWVYGFRITISELICISYDQWLLIIKHHMEVFKLQCPNWRKL